eukprot:6228381-Amphidinium_carterae.1
MFFIRGNFWGGVGVPFLAQWSCTQARLRMGSKNRPLEDGMASANYRPFLCCLRLLAVLPEGIPGSLYHAIGVIFDDISDEDCSVASSDDCDGSASNHEDEDGSGSVRIHISCAQAEAPKSERISWTACQLTTWSTCLGVREANTAAWYSSVAGKWMRQVEPCDSNLEARDVLRLRHSHSR